ncbi:hypothetical protein [Azospirillum argentinense]|uniref:hypothetical protein n=1 Tax=Azospirillum argentinense TaxID=2970906 RepID=UPI0015865C3F|nr:hypothetical protein [Azospirillum argentinense]
MPVEEHILEARTTPHLSRLRLHDVRPARGAKPALDVVVRDYINKGRIAGPRYLANGRDRHHRPGD